MRRPPSTACGATSPASAATPAPAATGATPGPREDADLREWFAGEAAARGLDLVEDRAGNVWAWWGDPDRARRRHRPGVVLGSHLDSVPDGGAFDGPLGVVSALAAVDALRARGVTPARPLGVASVRRRGGRPVRRRLRRVAAADRARSPPTAPARSPTATG